MQLEASFWSPDPLRGIKLPHDDPDYKQIGPVIYAILPLHLIHFPEESYQRPVPEQEAWAAETFEEEGFILARFEVISVAEKLGTYEGYNGGGRAALARLAGVQNVMCLIALDCDRVEAAAHFEGQANERATTRRDKHKARLVKNDQDACEIEQVAARYGYRIGKRADKMDTNSIEALGALYWIWDRGGETLLDDVIATVNGCFRHSTDGTKDRMLKGLAVFYRAFPPDIVDRTTALVAFKDVSPTQVLIEANKEANAAGGSNNSAEVAKYLLRAYNRNTGKRLRLGKVEAKKGRPRKIT